MDRNLLSETDPLVERIVHANNICTVGRTNFHMRLNPAGMALIKEIDPTAECGELFAHHGWVRKALIVIGVSHKLHTIEGFQKLWGYAITQHELERTDGFNGMSTLTSYLFSGFPYEVDCSNDSPLVGWFLVLGGRNG